MNTDQVNFTQDLSEFHILGETISDKEILTKGRAKQYAGTVTYYLNPEIPKTNDLYTIPKPDLPNTFIYTLGKLIVVSNTKTCVALKLGTEHEIPYSPNPIYTDFDHFNILLQLLTMDDILITQNLYMRIERLVLDYKKYRNLEVEYNVEGDRRLMSKLGVFLN